MAGSGNRNNRGRRKHGASSQSTAKRGAQNRRPRSNKRTKSKKRREGSPAWVWFLSGLALATAAAAVIYIAIQPDSGKMTTRANVIEPNVATPGSTSIPRKANTHSDKSASGHAATQGKASHKAPKQPQFAFYRMLPNYDAAIETGRPTSNTAHGSSESSENARHEQTTRQSGAATQNTEPPQTNQADNGGDGPWRIQVGAFSSRSSAQKRVAQLTLLGLDVGISEQTLDSGKTLYRVHSKKITSQQRLDEIRSKLAAHDIDLLVRNVGS